MSLKSTVKSGLNLYAIGGVIVGILVFNFAKTKIPQLG